MQYFLSVNWLLRKKAVFFKMHIKKCYAVIKDRAKLHSTEKLCCGVCLLMVKPLQQHRTHAKTDAVLVLEHTELLVRLN